MDLVFDCHLARPLIVSVEIFWKILDRRCDDVSAFAFCFLDDGLENVNDERHSSGRGKSFEVTSAVARRRNLPKWTHRLHHLTSLRRLSNLYIDLHPS